MSEKLDRAFFEWLYNGLTIIGDRETVFRLGDFKHRLDYRHFECGWNAALESNLETILSLEMRIKKLETELAACKKTHNENIGNEEWNGNTA